MAITKRYERKGAKQGRRKGARGFDSPASSKKKLTMREVIINHRVSKSKRHSLWKHYAGMTTNVIGNVVYLENAEYELLAQHFNESSSRLRNRLREVESELQDAERRSEYLSKVIEWLAAENERLAKKLDALTYATGDNGLNDLMNLM